MAYLAPVRSRSAAKFGAIPVTMKLRTIWAVRERGLSALLVLAVLGVWEWQVRAGRVSALFFPAPTVIGRTLARWVITGDLTPHLSATLLRVGVGFVVGGAGGLLLGLLMGWSRRVRVVIDPLIAAVHPVPKIAILPLIMILFGIGETSKIVVVVIAAFFPMLINTMAGVRQIQPLYFEVAANYGARPVQVFARVIIPGSLPLILTGMRLALNSALLITIAVELVTAQQGLGALVWLAWETLRTEELYASLAVTAALGMSFNVLLHYLTTVLVPWRTEESHP